MDTKRGGRGREGERVCACVRACESVWVVVPPNNYTHNYHSHSNNSPHIINTAVVQPPFKLSIH